MSRKKQKSNSGNSSSVIRWVIGTHSCKEAIFFQENWVQEVVIQEDKFREHSEIEELCKRKSISVKSKGKKFFNAIADGHQGVAVAMTDRPRWDDDSVNKEKSLVVFLDGITDPHNLGAILRTAWLLEVDGLFIPKERRVDLTPVVCKVSCGGAEHVPVESTHFASQLSWFKDQGYWIYGLSEKGRMNLPQAKFPEKTVLIVGAEGKGLRASTEKICDELVQIPQVQGGSSYNASVAFAMCAYECTRSRFL